MLLFSLILRFSNNTYKEPSIHWGINYLTAIFITWKKRPIFVGILNDCHTDYRSIPTYYHNLILMDYWESLLTCTHLLPLWISFIVCLYMSVSYVCIFNNHPSLIYHSTRERIVQIPDQILIEQVFCCCCLLDWWRNLWDPKGTYFRSQYLNFKNICECKYIF